MSEPSTVKSPGRALQQAGRCLGRDRELEQLIRCYDGALERDSAFVLVSGPPGIGKSTLLIEAQRRLRDRGALVLEGRCRPGLLSYRPLLEVARGAVEHLCEAGAAEEILLVGEHLLEVLGGQDLGERRGHNRTSFFDQMAILLQAVSDSRPVVVMLHDLGFADSGTLQLLCYLGRVLAGSPELPRGRFRGLLMANAENASAIPDQDGWSRGVNLVHIDLGGLDEDGVRAYLASDDVVSRVLQLTDGVPQRMDRIVIDNMVNGQPELELDLATFDGAERRILAILATFGRPLGPETLRLLSRLPQDALARAIAGLSQRQVIEKMVVDGELRVGLAQAGDQQTIYHALSDSERRVLHGEIGAYLESRGEREMEACAHHLLRGGDERRAVEVALEAGQRLERSFCFERAAELYERALELRSAAITEETFTILTDRLCATYEVTGELDQALEHARRARARRPEDPERALRIAHLHLVRGDFGAARVELDEIEATSAGLDAAQAARIQADRAWARYLAGDGDAAEGAARAGLALCNELAEGEDVASIRIGLRNTQGKIHLDQDRFDEARGLFLANLDEARAMGLPAEEVRALVQLGQTSLQLGDLSHAEEWYQAARELADGIGEHRYLGACLQHLGVLAERRRDYGRALDRYHEAVTIWKKVGHRSYLAWVGLDLGKLYLRLGDVSRATAMADLAERLCDREPPVATRINLALLRGRIAATECRYIEASERFSHARELAREADQPERETRALLDLATLELERGRSDRAKRLLSDELRSPVQGPLRTKALLLGGRAALEQGELEAARAQLGEALELSDTQGDPEAGWQARFLLASVSRKLGRLAEARRLLRDAAAAEDRVRASVPADLVEAIAEQPLRVALRRAMGDEQSREVPSSPRRRAEAPQPEPCDACGPIVGQHPRMRQIFAHIEKVAPTDALVLVRGESGTGKELIAEAIHRLSRRSSRPLVKVNCGALVESLLLSELFGHERGAFTGATQRRKGRFEIADGGTIFLDEIGDISPKTQVALLRVLQNQEFERVGGTESIRVDVRIICATNRDLEEMVRAGTFREDLYYRLRGVLMEVPPLRERGDDIELLADHFLARIARERSAAPRRLTPAAATLLRSHGWPGNVRELENVLRSVSLFADTELLDAGDFGDYPELRQAAPAGPSPQPGPVAPDNGHSPYARIRDRGISLKELKKEIEARCIAEALADADGNITRAAELLGMKRPRLSQLVKEHGIVLGADGGVDGRVHSDDCCQAGGAQ